MLKLYTASERDGGSMYKSRSQSNLTQLMTVCTRAGMGIGDGWERGGGGGGTEGEGRRERKERGRAIGRDKC